VYRPKSWVAFNRLYVPCCPEIDSVSLTCKIVNESKVIFFLACTDVFLTGTATAGHVCYTSRPIEEAAGSRQLNLAPWHINISSPGILEPGDSYF
jgi:hypothetical protein